MSREDDRTKVATWQKETAAMSPEEVVRWTAATFGAEVAFATSLGLEDQVLTDMIARSGAQIRLFTLDTGRLFPETYDLIERTEARYGMRIDVRFPNAGAVQDMVSAHGVNLFHRSVELRKHCCGVRKIQPLRDALAPLRAWVVGLRATQSITRSDLAVAEWDEGNGLVKVSPLVAWSTEQVTEYIRDNDVPYNPLHDQGFPSIGCACCTRAVKEGEDVRAGRWWWEEPEHKECGLHARPRNGVTPKGGTPDA